MIKKTILIMISLIMIFAVCGCQLAVEGREAAAADTDALCGMYITFEYIDSAMSGGQDGRIYAVPENNGGRKDVVFKGIEGLRLFDIIVYGDGENNNYSKSCADELLMHRNTAYNVTDEGTEMTLEATLYVCPKAAGEVFDCYCNPVYETPDGQVYMMAGSGISADMDAGASMSQTISGTMEKTADGKTESRKATIKFTVKAIDFIEKYVLKEYDSADMVVSTLEITKDIHPNEITLNKDTVYAVLEKHCLSNDGKPYVERSIVDMNSEYLDAKFINDQGFAQGYGITLKNRPVSTNA